MAERHALMRRSATRDAEPIPSRRPPPRRVLILTKVAEVRIRILAVIRRLKRLGCHGAGARLGARRVG